MTIGVAEISLVSPLGLSAAEHVFFFQAEVAPHASGAFTDLDGESLPVHDCPWIPASRPWSSRVRLLAAQALARARPASKRTPVVLVAPEEASSGDAELSRFLSLSGYSISAVHSGSAAYVTALREAQEALRSEAEVIVLAVDSLLSRSRLERWLEERYSGFTRNPLPPSEGAAAMRLVASSKPPLAGKVLSFASARSAATDDNDVAADGVALTRALADLDLAGEVPLLVGPIDVDPLRMRDHHLATARHHARLGRAEMPSLEGKIGALGSAAGLMAAVFATAWLRHGLPLPEPVKRRVGVAWARSKDGTVGAVMVGEERS